MELSQNVGDAADGIHSSAVGLTVLAAAPKFWDCSIGKIFNGDTQCPVNVQIIQSWQTCVISDKC